MTNNQLTEQQIDLLIENGYDIAHTLENLAENEINSDCFEVFSYSENGRETEWDGKITEFAQRAAKAIRHLTDATTALQAELQERRQADSEPVAVREPIAWLNDAYLARGVVDGEAGSEDAGPGFIPVYREAQPAPVVPDEVTAEDCPALVKYDVTEVDEAWACGFNACRAAMLQDEPVTTANKLGNSPVIPDASEDTKRLNWLDAQNKRLNEYYGTSYGWKFDANFQRNAMMLNDSNYPVMTVRQAIDEAIAAAPQEVK